MELDLHRLELRFEATRIIDTAAVQRLANSIQDSGQLVACIAALDQDSGALVLIDGYRRVNALKRLGRDPFNELVIPATGIKLLQWTGRAIRTEEDRARVICYDKRLLQTAYGKRMLSGLPPYRLDKRGG